MGVIWPHRAGYRVWQFVQALLAWWRPLPAEELAQVRAALPAGAWQLFLGMPRSDQRHSFRVWRSLQAQGHTEPALLQAALLHDCAKHLAGVRLWHRVAVVLLAALMPSWLERWGGQEAPAGWRYPFWAHANHPRLGAQLAAAAGCEARAVALIRSHQDPVPLGDHRDPLLAALQAADGNH